MANEHRPSGSSFTSLLKRILFRDAIKHSSFQSFFSHLHTLSIFAMNYGGGGLIESSGEAWAIENVVKQLLSDQPTPIVFDVGANTGDYALLVSKHLPGASIYAFEPSRKTFEQLAEHVKEHQEIKCFNLGFSDQEKTVELFSYTVEGAQASLLASIDQRLPTQVVDVVTSGSETIEVSSIDRFCNSKGVERVDFLKLDVEGHEVAILRGARRMLEEGRISVIQFEFGPANIYSRTFFYDFWSLLADTYDISRIIPQGIVPLHYYGEHQEIFLTTNYLAIRKGLT